MILQGETYKAVQLVRHRRRCDIVVVLVVVELGGEVVVLIWVDNVDITESRCTSDGIQVSSILSSMRTSHAQCGDLRGTRSTHLFFVASVKNSLAFSGTKPGSGVNDTIFCETACRRCQGQHKVEISTFPLPKSSA